MDTDRSSTSDALLLVAQGCVHCASMLDSLSKLVKDGAIGRLEVVNIASHPEVAEQVGTRSVPWTRIGKFELAGAYTVSELTHWAELAAQDSGLAEYYGHLLNTGQLPKVNKLIRERADNLRHLVMLLSQADASIGVRIGISAVLEDLQGTDQLNSIIPELSALTCSELPHARADACHYLGLTDNPDVIPVVRKLLNDDSAEVQDVAKETLEALEAQ
jgi:hypothetical protein